MIFGVPAPQRLEVAQVRIAAVRALREARFLVVHTPGEKGNQIGHVKRHLE